jgi:hypothetical protein
MTEPVKPEDPAQEVRRTALEMALNHHGHSETPAAAKTVVVTAQAFARFLEDGGLFDIAQVAAEQRERRNPS